MTEHKDEMRKLVEKAWNESYSAQNQDTCDSWCDWLSDEIRALVEREKGKAFEKAARLIETHWVCHWACHSRGTVNFIQRMPTNEKPDSVQRTWAAAIRALSKEQSR